MIMNLGSPIVCHLILSYPLIFQLKQPLMSYFYYFYVVLASEAPYQQPLPSRPPNYQPRHEKVPEQSERNQT